MAASDTNQQTVQSISSLITGQLPFPGTWYYPNSGVNQLVYPDFQPANVANQIYFPSYQIANLYAAYTSDPDRLAFTTTDGDSPVTNGSAYVDMQTTGMANVLKGAFGSITWGLSASDQTTLAQAEEAANAALNTVNSAVEKAYDENFIFNTTYPSSNSSASNLTESLQSLAYVIANNPELMLPGTGVYKSYQQFKSQDNLVGFQAQLVSNLVAGNLNWANTFTQGFGTQSPITGAYQYTIPWNATLYSQYQSAISSSAYTTWKNLTSLQQSNSSAIQFSTQYLTDLENYNSNPSGFYTTPTSDFFSVVPGYPGADTYAPLYTVTALNTESTGNSISFELYTDSYNSTEATANSSTKVSWGAAAGANGWWWSSNASNSGSSVNQTSWGEFDSTASQMTGTFEWDEIQQRSIAPSSSWYNGNALSQAWGAGMAANNPNFKGGFAFSTPDLANQYIQASLYYPSSIAYGNPSATLNTSTENISEYSASSFSSFENTTTAQKGFGWGPFSVGSSTSVSTSNQESNSQYDWSASGTTATITNNPLEGVTGSPSTGDPAAILGFQLTQIGAAQAVMVSPSKSSSSIRSGMSTEMNMDDRLITYSNPDANSTEKRRYMLGKGKDTHYGHEGRDFVTGEEGDDVLAGLDGNDYLYGDNGDDVIYGGAGRNKIWGGSGKDYVVFERNHVENGAFNKVMDWSKKDRLSFSGYIPEDVTVKGRSLFLDGDRAAVFKGMNSSELETLVAAAHYSQM